MPEHKPPFGRIPWFGTVAEAKAMLDLVVEWGEDYRNQKVVIMRWEDAKEIGKRAMEAESTQT